MTFINVTEAEKRYAGGYKTGGRVITINVAHIVAMWPVTHNPYSVSPNEKDNIEATHIQTTEEVASCVVIESINKIREQL